MATSASASASSRSACVTSASRSRSRPTTGTAIARRCERDLGFGRCPLLGEAATIAVARRQVRGEASVTQLKIGQGGSGGLVRLPPLALDVGAGGELLGEARRDGLGRLQGRHRLGCLIGRPCSSVACRREPPRRLVPARMGGGQQGGRELVADRRPGGLTFRLRRQSAGLRAKLRQDVVDPGEVGLGLDQLFLGLASTPLVATHTGDLLEQRAPFLGSQGESLVDHALADEQERVVGEVGGIEQVDEVAQADALLVEQVLVLAAAVEPPAELEDLELDRQEAVGVVEHEGDVGHALRRALLRPGPDDVLGLARAERPALLAERPAERVGQVALAGAVRPDDRADPAAELDVGSLGERLEALDPQREQPRRGVRRWGHAGACLVLGAADASSLGCPLGADALDGLRRGRCLGHPARRPFAAAEHLAVDPDLDPERLLVVRPRRGHEPVIGAFARPALCVFLQT